MVGNAYNEIVSATTPQPIHVQLCKVLISSEFRARQGTFSAPRPEDLLPIILKNLGCSSVQKMSVRYPEAPLPPKDVLDALTYTRAYSIAVAQLVSSGFLLPAGELRPFAFEIPFEETIAGTLHGSLFKLTGMNPWLPSQVMQSSSAPSDAEIYVPDLFLKSISSAPINADISAFLADAVECFRHDLFRPAIVMLGSANEGVWIELGRKVAMALPTGIGQFQQDGFLEDVENPKMSIAAKQELICDSFDRLSPEKQKLWRKGGLQECKEFAKYLREDRNALHFGKSPVHDDTFAKTAVLMLETGAHIRRIVEVTSQL